MTSDRIVRSAGVDFNSPAGARLFLDPLTGADVRHFGIGEVEIVNTNAVDPLEVHGISERFGSSTLVQQDATIAAGGAANFAQDAIEPTYLDLIVLRIGRDPARAVALHLTCGVGDDTVSMRGALVCIGVRQPRRATDIVRGGAHPAARPGSIAQASGGERCARGPAGPRERGLPG